MPKYFGTDGIRGIPFDFPFEPEFIKKIGYSVAKKLKKSKKKVFIARDTRESGEKITDLLARGISKHSIEVVDLGVITTPSLSYILSQNEVSFGIMVSASHNPPEFNGIKVLTSKGEKISEKTEEEIEKIIDSVEELKYEKAELKKLDFSSVYIDYVHSLFDGILKDKKIVIDCSNGASYKIAPEIFKKTCADFYLIGDKPNGKNINVGCGALETNKMREMVKEKNAFCGISYDGDSDRCIIADENGNIVDGDEIIAFLSIYYKKNKMLDNNTVVLTHMSNYGVFEFLKTNGIKVLSVDVGDRNVSHTMDRHKAVIGGEPSGHIIIKKYLPTGDGMITSLEFLSCVIKSKMKVSDVKKLWKRFPSNLRCYRVSSKPELKTLKGFDKRIKEIEKDINGRIFVRYSGTEPVLRILIEADKEENYLNKISQEIFSFYLSLAKEIRRGDVRS